MQSLSVDVHNRTLNEYINRLNDAVSSPERAWWMVYQERRLRSKEDRILRQVSIEKSWSGTPLGEFWKQLCTFSIPAQNYTISAASFTEYLLSIGITSAILQQRIFSVFLQGGASTEPQSLSALLLCKAVQMGLDDENVAPLLLHHCFSSFPLRTSDVGSVVVNHYAINEAHKKLSEKKKKKRTIADNRAIDLYESFAIVFPFYRELPVDFDLFASSVVFPESARLVASLAKPLLEACCKYFSPPFGSFPLIPQRWKNAIAPLPYQPTATDADSFLFREVEESGVDPNAKTKKRKRRAASKKKDTRS